MDTIDVDLSAPALTDAIVGNTAETFALIGSSIGEVVRVDETLVFFSGLPLPPFNGAICPRFSAETADERIEWVVEQARMRGVPMVWQLGPGTEPQDLAVRLKARGFVAGEPLPGMAAILDSLEDEPTPDGVSIGCIHELEKLREATLVMCEVFGIPTELEPPFTRLLASEGNSRDALIVTYGASIAGKLVGTATVVYVAGVAGIYNVTTLEGYRGRGIGRAVTLAPLLDARRRGYRVGILESSHMGYSVYRNLGFQHICDFDTYAWLDVQEPGAEG